MSADLFDFVSERLEQQTALDRLAARGTLRIALKTAGLATEGLRVDQIRVVLARVLPDELEKCGVDSARPVCAAILAALASAPITDEPSASNDADEIFRRLGGS